MRRLVLTGFIALASLTLFAQTDSIVTPKPTVPLPHSSDHIMLQVGYTTWTGLPSNVNTSGIPRSFNAYFLFDFPFKTNPQWSAAIGAGVTTDNIYFKETYVGLKDATSTLQFTDQSDTTHFKKNKVATTFLEAPIELRFTAKPNDAKHSFKAAAGLKVGTLLNAHFKGKELQNSNDNTLNSYVLKESSKRFFNQNRLSLTGRIGYGNLSLFTSYSISPLFKEGLAPTIRPLTIGINLSGL